MYKYNDTISFWDDIFVKEKPKQDTRSIKIHDDLESAIHWLSNGSNAILDYGSGSGTMLFKCASYDNVRKCLGIDISQKAVELARKTALLNNLESRVEFLQGEVNTLEKIEENSFDGAILSNIIDNVVPDDAISIMKNIRRILTANGKILIKVNPHLTPETIDEYGLKPLDNNLYMENEGIYLRNLSTSEWKIFFKQFFDIKEYKEIYFQQFDQYNRLFFLTNSK